MSPEAEEILGSLVLWRDRAGVPPALRKLLEQLAEEVAAGGLDWLSGFDLRDGSLAGDADEDTGGWADPVV